MGLLDEAAEAIGGPPLRYAVLLGVGVGFTLLKDSKRKPEKEDFNPIDFAIRAGDLELAERLIRQTLPISRQDEALVQLRRIRERLGPQIARVAEWNRQLGELVDSNRYSDAVSLAQRIDIDPTERRRVIGQIRAAEQRAEWNRQLTELVNSARYSEAVSFVKSIEINALQQKHVITQIRAKEKRNKKYAAWDHKISALVAKGEFDKALAFLDKTDLTDHEHEQVGKQIRERQRAAERREKAESWSRELGQLLSEQRFEDALRLAKQIDIEEEQRRDLITRLRELRSLAGRRK